MLSDSSKSALIAAALCAGLAFAPGAQCAKPAKAGATKPAATRSTGTSASTAVGESGFLNEAARLQGIEYIKELQAKIRKAERSNAGAAGGASALGPVASVPSVPSASAGASSSPSTSARHGLRLVQVTGLGNRLTAAIELGNGSLVQVRRGDHLLGWRVRSVSASKVVLTKARAHKTLFMSYTGFAQSYRGAWGAQKITTVAAPGRVPSAIMLGPPGTRAPGAPGPDAGM